MIQESELMLLYRVNEVLTKNPSADVRGELCRHTGAEKNNSGDQKEMLRSLEQRGYVASAELCDSVCWRITDAGRRVLAATFAR